MLKCKEIIKRYIKDRRGGRILFFLLLAVFSLLPAGAQKVPEEVHTSRYYVSRAQDYQDANAWDASKKEIDEGLELYPSDPDLRFLNGRYYYYARRDLPKARYNLIKAIQESDQHWGARRLMIDVEDDSKHFSSAVCYINELLEEMPYDRDLWRRKIALYYKMGNKVEGDASLERLARIYPNDTLVRNDLAARTRENWNKRLNGTTLGERAATLEQWIDADLTNLDYYLELVDIYIRRGDYEKALNTAKRGLGMFPGNSDLVRYASNLMSEQGLYTRALTFLKENNMTGNLYENVMREAAHDARLKDPYDISGRLYATSGDPEALQYLLNTSLTRGYYDDALMYLHEAYKKEGRTTPLLLKEYELHRRMGNEKQARRLLNELYTLNPADNDLKEEYIVMEMELANLDAEQEQWEAAYERLSNVSKILDKDSEAWAAVISREIAMLGRMGRLEEARRLYASASVDNPEMRKRFASAYEDLVALRIKGYIEDERYVAALNEAQALYDVMFDSEVAIRALINMSQTLKREDMFHKYAAIGYELFPDQPYFIIKQAVALQEQGQYADALQLLVPQKPGELYANPQLVNPFAGITQDWAILLMKEKMPDIAIQKLEEALVYDPENSELLYLEGLAYEQLKEFDKAYRLQNRNYNPSNAELGEWNEHMRYLRFRSFRNHLDISYTSAYFDSRSEELASIGHLYSIASLAYSHLWKNHTLTAQISYKGIDGYNTSTEYVAGGIGLEFMAQWETTIKHNWGLTVNGSYSTKFFNKFGGNVSVSYTFDKGWMPALKAGYRRTEPMFLYKQQNGIWLYEYGAYNLLLLTPSIEKSWERIKLSAGVDLISLNLDNFYYNVGLKGKMFVTEDNISAVGIMAGFGSFPEITFFDQTTMNGITHTNAMVGVEGVYLITKNLYASLAGMWNTYYNPAFIQGATVSSYRNIFSINLSLHLAF